MTPIQWLVSQPAPPATEPPRTRTVDQKIHVRRNNGQYVERQRHRRELEQYVLAAMVAAGEPVSSGEVCDSLPLGILTTAGRATQCAEVTVVLNRLYMGGHLWKDGKVWGVE